MNNERYAVIVIGETEISTQGSVEEHWFDSRIEAEVVFESFCDYHEWVELRDTHNEDEEILLCGGTDFADIHFVD